MNTNIKEYTLFFLNDEQPRIIEGRDICDALHRYGYPNPATILKTVDFYGEGDIRDQYCFCQSTGCWKQKV